MPLAIGPASRPPVAATSAVDWTLVSTTDTAYCGASAGAKATIQAWDRSGFDGTPSSAVPVLAATGIPPFNAMQQLAVPRSATPIINPVSIAAVVGEIGVFHSSGVVRSSTRSAES